MSHTFNHIILGRKEYAARSPGPDDWPRLGAHAVQMVLQVLRTRKNNSPGRQGRPKCSALCLPCTSSVASGTMGTTSWAHRPHVRSSEQGVHCPGKIYLVQPPAHFCWDVVDLVCGCNRGEQASAERTVPLPQSACRTAPRSSLRWHIDHRRSCSMRKSAKTGHHRMRWRACRKSRRRRSRMTPDPV